MILPLSCGPPKAPRSAAAAARCKPSRTPPARSGANAGDVHGGPGRPRPSRHARPWPHTIRCAYRRAAWCSLSEAGGIVGEGAMPAEADGLSRLVIERGSDVRAVVEMMSGASWVRDRLVAAGWRVQVAHARKVRDVVPLACK